MAPVYAGILGPLAFLTTLLRGTLHGGQADAVLFSAWCCLWAFAVVGFLVGWVAERTVADAVAGRVAAELAQRKAEQSPITGAMEPHR